MVRPLTRKTAGGILYSRSKTIEDTIGEALHLSPDDLRRRAKIWNRGAPEYLPSECLVHLIRDAGRSQNRPLVTDLMQTLGQRCARTLFKQIPNGVPGAAEIREIVLTRLSVLFLEEMRDGTCDDLDFYEVRFNQAFCRLWLEVRATEWRRLRHEALSPPAEARNATEDSEPGAREDADEATGEPRDVLGLRNLQAALNGLPSDQREAVRLRYFEGLEVESNDPSEMTVAKKLCVSGRTVRKRLEKAFATLRAKMEADNGYPAEHPHIAGRDLRTLP